MVKNAKKWLRRESFHVLPDYQGDRKGRPYNTRMRHPSVLRMYCTGGPCGRPEGLVYSRPERRVVYMTREITYDSTVTGAVKVYPTPGTVIIYCGLLASGSTFWRRCRI